MKIPYDFGHEIGKDRGAVGILNKGIEIRTY